MSEFLLLIELLKNSYSLTHNGAQHVRSLCQPCYRHAPLGDHYRRLAHQHCEGL